ncbi:ankyrin [Macroventuria anomochaeta]|uniref:Ankyrin n=1 Tax=Macroventuria anomochaeta TaxID=301207 RepID=A0ACB6S0H9_9PLEO|nr:ankyrin [Macroventuria anomochaeta]KAF2627529.1 ankyrin [Macroventuria anomochaeta]
MVPLQDASRKGHTSVVAALLAEGANATVKDATGRTAIHHAARAGDIDAVKMLIASGADLDGLDVYGHSVLSLAAASGNEDLAEFLLRLRNTTWSAAVIGVALAFAAALGLKSLTRSLLSSSRFNGPDDTLVQQAFIASVVSGSEEILLLFLALGCHPDLQDSKYGQSALSIAAAGGHDRVVRILLEHGACANIQDVRTGITPVMHAISRGYPLIVQLLLEYGAELDFPKERHENVDDGWIYKIFLALIHQCPNGDKGRSSNRKSTSPSTKAVIGSPNQAQETPSSFDQTHKRSRSKKRLDDSEEGSDDEHVATKKSRHDKGNDAQFMCPFHKRYPDKHTCPPYTKVARLKEHIHRRHHKVFCVHCWKIFKDEAAVARHHKNDKCEEQDRTDYSGGICNSQASALKSRVGIQRISEEEHWEKVFRIVFPDFQDRMPSPSYYTTSETFTEAVQRMFLDPCLQSGLAPLLGGNYETVRNIILAFASNQRMAEADASLGGAIQVRPRQIPSSTLNGGRADEPALTVASPSNNNNGLQRRAPAAQQIPESLFWAPLDMMGSVLTVPNLQHAHSGPPFAHVPSDSGVGTQHSSMFEEPQGRGMYHFGSMDTEDTTTSDGPGQTMPYFSRSVDTLSTFPDNYWNMERQQQLSGHNVGEVVFDNVTDPQLDPSVAPGNCLPTTHLPGHDCGASQQGKRRGK